MGEPQPTQNTQIDGGYIVLARQILKSDIFFWKPPEWLKIWIYILLKVQYQNGRHFARGTEYFNWEEDKRNLKGVTKHQWYHCIEFLRKQGMIATQKTTRGNIVKVLKYDTYQNPALYKSETKSEAGAKQKRSTSETILKELKKGRKKEDKDMCVEIFSFWKKELNHPKALLTKDRQTKISARLKEGYTLEQAKDAIKGCKLSSYHMGDNPRGRVYDSIELIFRNGDKIEQFINIYKEVLKYGKTRKSGKRDIRKGWKESEKYRHLYRK